MQYLDLATNNVEVFKSLTVVNKSKSWTSSHEHEPKFIFDGGHDENDRGELSFPHINENPFDSCNLYKESLRSASLSTYTVNKVDASGSTDTFESISTCAELRTASDLSKVHYKKFSPKFKKNGSKDNCEHQDMSMTMMMSPVVKRKMSKAHNVLLEQESIKPDMRKRTSVVFNLMEEGKVTTEVEENSSRIALNNPRRISQNALGGHRPSIFSVFSQVAGRSHRPSIFSRLSDFSIGSLGIDSSWNFRRIFLVMFLSCSFFILATILLIFFWPKMEFDVNHSKSFRHI